MTSGTQTVLPPARARRAAGAVFAIFALNGFTFANWVSRLPTIRDELSLSPREIGLILLVGSLGSIVALPLAGSVISRFGAERTVVFASLVAGLGLTAAVVGVSAVQPLVVALGLFVSMTGIASWDVGMNFEGTRVEQALRRAIMPWFHGGYSLGTVFGAGVGALATFLHVSVAAHLIVVVVVVFIAVLALVRGLLPDEPAHEEAHADTPRAGGGFMRAWLEGRTLLVGLVVLAAALTEGAANDWLALAVVDGFDVPNAIGALGFTIFVAAMTIMRFVGTALLDRFGRVAVLRLCTGLAIVGLLTFTLVPSLPVALAGAVLWGMGAALGFPVGMSAAADEPARAAARISVVATIGYTAFLAGPPLLGLLADHIGYRHALLAILVPLVVGLLVIPFAAPPASPPVGVAPARPAKRAAE